MRYSFRPRRVPEKDVVVKVDGLLKQIGFESVHFSQARESNQTPGIPDRLYTKDAIGFAFWWEAKSDDGTQLWEQQQFERRMVACHHFYVKGNRRDVLDFLIVHQLWRLPAGVEARQVAGAPWKEKLETAEQYERRIQKAKERRRGVRT